MDEAREFWSEADVISVYTREQALEDGFLVAVPPGLQREAGFKFPVALCADVWAEAVATSDVEERAGQSVEGRLWDILSVMMFAIRRSRGPSDMIRFSVSVAKESGRRTIKLMSVCGPGDNMEPVITVKLDKAG